MFKHFIIRNLHSLLGFENYLFIFSVIKIRTLELDSRKKEFVFFSRMFKEDSNVLILGANTGITTVPVARNISKGRVIAIEPVPDNFKTLVSVTDYFKCRNVTALNFALGKENRDIEMYMPVINKTKSHGLAYVNDESIEGFEEGIKYRVMMKKLDSVEEVSDLKIDGIKIVAENYEKNILEGGKDTLMKHRPLIYCELWFNENRKNTLSLIKSWNYEIRILNNGKLIPADESLIKTKNLFFIPAERTGEFKNYII
ncbi:MAG: FkbM family methyltransferase [Ignavibacteria bacterium]|nr:FkbM family methyltransferase [Ignavibacteria bacterium]